MNQVGRRKGGTWRLPRWNVRIFTRAYKVVVNRESDENEFQTSPHITWTRRWKIDSPGSTVRRILKSRGLRSKLWLRLTLMTRTYTPSPPLKNPFLIFTIYRGWWMYQWDGIFLSVKRSNWIFTLFSYAFYINTYVRT